MNIKEILLFYASGAVLSVLSALEVHFWYNPPLPQFEKILILLNLLILAYWALILINRRKIKKNARSRKMKTIGLSISAFFLLFSIFGDQNSQMIYSRFFVAFSLALSFRIQPSDFSIFDNLPEYVITSLFSARFFFSLHDAKYSVFISLITQTCVLLFYGFVKVFGTKRKED